MNWLETLALTFSKCCILVYILSCSEWSVVQCPNVKCGRANCVRYLQARARSSGRRSRSWRASCPRRSSAKRCWSGGWRPKSRRRRILWSVLGSTTTVVQMFKEYRGASRPVVTESICAVRNCAFAQNCGLCPFTRVSKFFFETVADLHPLVQTMTIKRSPFIWHALSVYYAWYKEY